MKNNAKIFAPVILIILIGSLTFIFAQIGGSQMDNSRPDKTRDFGPPPDFRPGAGLNPRMIEQLNLTDAQKELVRAIEVNSRAASREYSDKIKPADEQLRRMVEGGSFNEEQARQILSVKTEAMTELEIIRLRTDAAIFNLLTAEQKMQLAQLKEKRSELPPRGSDFRHR